MGEQRINTKKNLISLQKVWSVPSYEKVQSILSTSNNSIGSEQFRKLSQKIFNSIIESSITNKEYIGNAVSTVLDWHKTSGNGNIYNICDCSEGDYHMNEWQKHLYSKVAKKKQTLKVCMFADSFWVIVKRPSTGLVFKYSQDLTELYEVFSELFVDFLVLGIDQFECSYIPEDALILEVNHYA